jgi:hypothetical protein
MQPVEQGWAGIDAGKGHHHLVLIDAEGCRLLSRRVANDETELGAVIDAVLGKAVRVSWAIDLVDTPAALIIALLLERAQPVVHLAGAALNRAAAAYRGPGQDRRQGPRDHRRSGTHATGPARTEDPGHRDRRTADADRPPRRPGRRAGPGHQPSALSSAGRFPGLERELDFTNQGPPILISMFQTPESITEVGGSELEGRLRERGVRLPARLAAAALNAAEAQPTRPPGEATAAALIAGLAARVLDLDRQLAELDELIARVHAHRQAAVLTSMVGTGDLLGAEYLAATGGDLSGFASPDHLAGHAALAPTPRDSRRRAGNLHPPKRYNRQLQRVFYTSALISIRCCPASRAYHDRKRAEGKRHTQAVLALARRRVNVLWAMLRDNRTHQERPCPAPIAA